MTESAQLGSALGPLLRTTRWVACGGPGSGAFDLTLDSGEMALLARKASSRCKGGLFDCCTHHEYRQ